jgi:hypothetical protein
MLGCERAAPLPTAPAADEAAPSPLTPTYIDADFVNIYQTLLLNGLSDPEKTERWARFYKQRYVRWSGQLFYIKKDSLRFRELDSTGTYDVYLRIATAPGRAVPSLTIGRYYNYVGRLDTYDDGFHTVYLDQGVVFDAGPDGVPGLLTPAPPMTRRLSAPPSVIASPLP